MTRLGEFSPTYVLGYSFLCSVFFLKITEVAQILGLLFFQETSSVLMLTKNGLGYFFRDVFTNSSGHPSSMAT
jgi:hypothetical protein